jgi:drug/metabolite transporter (DMT)-like permease
MESNQLRGIFYMMAAMLLISVQEALAKYLGQTLPVAQVVWARYLGHLVLMIILLWPKNGMSLLKTNKLFIQITRSLILLIDTVLFFFGLTMLGLAEATAIFFTVPLLVLLLSIPLLGERVSASSIVAIIVGFIGTLIIVRPGINGLGSSDLGIGALFIFGAACCTAIYNVTTRKLSASEPISVTLFYTAIVGAVVTSLFLPFIWQAPTSLEVWAALIFIGLFGGSAHSLIIISHKYAAATTVAPFIYSQIFWALGLGWLMFGELPDFYVYLGGVIVISSGLYLFYHGRTRVNTTNQQLDKEPLLVTAVGDAAQLKTPQNRP